MYPWELFIFSFFFKMVDMPKSVKKTFNLLSKRIFEGFKSPCTATAWSLFYISASSYTNYSAIKILSYNLKLIKFFFMAWSKSHFLRLLTRSRSELNFSISSNAKCSNLQILLDFILLKKFCRCNNSKIFTLSILCIIFTTNSLLLPPPPPLLLFTRILLLN